MNSLLILKSPESQQLYQSRTWYFISCHLAARTGPELTDQVEETTADHIADFTVFDALTIFNLRMITPAETGDEGGFILFGDFRRLEHTTDTGAPTATGFQKTCLPDRRRDGDRGRNPGLAERTTSHSE